MPSSKIDSFQLKIGDGPTAREIGFLALGFVCDNLTNQWVFLSEPFIFCPPYTVAQSGPIPGCQKLTARFLAPVGFTNPTTISDQSVNIRTTADPQPSSPGVAIAPGTVRWAITARPAVGVMGTVTKPAVPGVIHVADVIVAAMFDSAAAGGIAYVDLIDGISGGPTLLLETLLGSTATTGTGAPFAIGPGLGIKGSIGVAMTLEFQSPQAGNFQSVTLIGYDA